MNCVTHRISWPTVFGSRTIQLPEGEIKIATDASITRFTEFFCRSLRHRYSAGDRGCAKAPLLRQTLTPISPRFRHSSERLVLVAPYARPDGVCMAYRDGRPLERYTLSLLQPRLNIHFIAAIRSTPVQPLVRPWNPRLGFNPVDDPIARYPPDITPNRHAITSRTSPTVGP